jgi:septal ring factor EnvC (AmiA/AmiB activator)
MSECAKLKKQADALELERLRREYEELNNKSDRQLKELNVSSQTILTLEAKVRKVEAESGNATKAQQQLRQDLDRSRVDLETALVEKSRLQDKFDNLRSFLSAEEASPNKASDGVKVDIDAEGEENDSKGEYLT